jgi:hypothetical protein
MICIALSAIPPGAEQAAQSQTEIATGTMPLAMTGWSLQGSRTRSGRRSNLEEPPSPQSSPAGEGGSFGYETASVAMTL